MGSTDLGINNGGVERNLESAKFKRNLEVVRDSLHLVERHNPTISLSFCFLLLHLPYLLSILIILLNKTIGWLSLQSKGIAWSFTTLGEAVIQINEVEGKTNGRTKVE